STRRNRFSPSISSSRSLTGFLANKGFPIELLSLENTRKAQIIGDCIIGGFCISQFRNAPTSNDAICNTFRAFCFYLLAPDHDRAVRRPSCAAVWSWDLPGGSV